MAELEVKEKQPCAEVTENKDDSHVTPHSQEENELDKKENEEHAKERKQSQSEEEHREYFEESCLKKKKTDEQGQGIVGKLMARLKVKKTIEPEEKKSELAENVVKEEVTKDLVQKTSSHCEKNHSPEEKNVKVDVTLDESIKEESHRDKGNQSQGVGEHKECFKEPCPKNEKREEQDGDVEEQEDKTTENASSQTEKNDEPEEGNRKADWMLEKEKRQGDGGEPRVSRRQSSEPIQNPIQKREQGNNYNPDEDKKKYISKLEKIKYFTIQTGITCDSHKEFLTSLHKRKSRLKQVDKPAKCTFIQVFCPVVSRAKTDIEAALRQLNKISDTKPAVLVVLHCTNDPECFVPDSSRVVTRDNIIAVDCLFHEDNGLYKCLKNDKAVDKVAQWLKDKPWKN